MDSTDATDAVGIGSVYLKLRAQEVLQAKYWFAVAGQSAFVTSTVAELTGTPARTFREWVTDHAAEFRN